VAERHPQKNEKKLEGKLNEIMQDDKIT